MDDRVVRSRVLHLRNLAQRRRGRRGGPFEPAPCGDFFGGGGSGSGGRRRQIGGVGVVGEEVVVDALENLNDFSLG